MLTNRFVLLAALGILLAANFGCNCVKCTCYDLTEGFVVAAPGFEHITCDLKICGYPNSQEEEIVGDEECAGGEKASSVGYPVPDPQFAAR